MRRRVLPLALAAAALPVLAGAPGKAGDAETAVGERVLSEFCLSCHALDAPGENALRPRLRASKLWATEGAAYRNIGRLEQINRAMMVRFSGTDEERRALAKVLARLASEPR